MAAPTPYAHIEIRDDGRPWLIGTQIKVLDRTCWCILGAICLPNLLMVGFLLASHIAAPFLATPTSLWCVILVGLACGVECIRRLPLHWYPRASIALLYVPFKGYFLMEACERLWGGLFG